MSTPRPWRKNAGNALSAEIPTLPGELLQNGVAAGCEYDAGAPACECQGGRSSDAARRTCNDDSQPSHALREPLHVPLPWRQEHPMSDARRNQVLDGAELLQLPMQLDRVLKGRVQQNRTARPASRSGQSKRGSARKNVAPDQQEDQQRLLRNAHCCSPY